MKLFFILSVKVAHRTKNTLIKRSNIIRVYYQIRQVKFENARLITWAQNTNRLLDAWRSNLNGLY